MRVREKEISLAPSLSLFPEKKKKKKKRTMMKKVEPEENAMKRKGNVSKMDMNQSDRLRESKGERILIQKDMISRIKGAQSLKIG